MAWRDITVNGLRDLCTVNGLLSSMIRHWKQHELRRVADTLSALSGDTVLGGPFAGMLFGNRRSRSMNMPKLIGSYECELHEIVKRLIERRFPAIINIGAAEGYYAVGMAVKCPHTQVIAFEMEQGVRTECAANAALNKVEDRITILGQCDSRSLQAMQLDNTLIILDGEGAELDIRNEDIAPKLTNTWLLIELHDMYRSGCSRILSQRFEKTHRMEFTNAVSRNSEEFALLKGLRPRQKSLALDESRMGAQEWVLMIPKY